MYLTCMHHVYMSLATYVAVTCRENANVLVIGLGGGGLCMFLRKFLPKIHVMAIDIDAEMLNVAKDWFNLQEDDKLKITICDGLQYLKDSCKGN